MATRTRAVSKRQPIRTQKLAAALAEAAAQENVLGAALRAQKASRGLVSYLPSAFASAADSPYGQYERVEEALLAVAEVARIVRAARKAKKSCGSLEQLFLDRGVHFRAHISKTSRTQYGEEYRVLYNGRWVSIAPHLVLGKGGPKTCLRIHFFIDEKAPGGWLPVIAHCGRHLTNTKTS